MRFEFKSGAVLREIRIAIPKGMHAPTVSLSAWRRDGEATKFGGVAYFGPEDCATVIDKARQIAIEEGETRWDSMTPEEERSLDAIRTELFLMAATAAPQVA